LRNVLLPTIAIVLLAFSAAPLISSASTPDIKYVANPPYALVSPGTVVPNDVPNCLTGNPNVPTAPIIFCYSPNFIQSAYNLTPLYASGKNGTGQTIVIVDAFGSPTIESDLANFDTVFGLLPPPSFTIICPLSCPSFHPNNIPHDVLGWTIETTLDVEWSHAIAPGAKIVLAVAPTSSGDAINGVESFVVAHYPGSIISQSFGIPEAFLTGNNAQVAQAHANYVTAKNNKITVLASSGDSGATNGLSIANALFPSSDPLVLSIGGTQGDPLGNLVTFDENCSPGPRPGFPTGCTPTGYGSEAVWNEAWLPLAGGGAPSLIFPAPPYQSRDGSGFTARTTPDVSYNAAVDGGVLVFWTACLPCISPTFTGWFVVGGTSAGSPQWAAIFAIVNQVRAGKGPIGFANQAIYTIAESASYASDFHDIIVGDNILSGSTIGFPAGPGYDLASGWGTPNAANVVADLAAT